jgi:hypothetical protein
MPKSLSQLREQLSDIEPTERFWQGAFAIRTSGDLSTVLAGLRLYLGGGRPL